jgi:hypothetical protein
MRSLLIASLGEPPSWNRRNLDSVDERRLRQVDGGDEHHPIIRHGQGNREIHERVECNRHLVAHIAVDGGLELALEEVYDDGPAR